MSAIIQYLSCSLWLISLSTIPSRSIHVVANGKISFFFMANNIPLCVHRLFWIMMQWTWEYRYLCEILFSFLWIYSQIRNAWSFDSSIFNILRDLHMIFHSGYINLQFHQQSTNIPFSPHLHQYLLFDDSHSDRCEVMSHSGFNLHFPDD